jgi:hypothetical protein
VNIETYQPDGGWFTLVFSPMENNHSRVVDNMMFNSYNPTILFRLLILLMFCVIVDNKIISSIKVQLRNWTEQVGFEHTSCYQG